ncbi:MAG: hypothetical protein J2P48_02205, partial [Alphaproteobacteria bacterium]|nr:hypothetical protein [Alphaproteobacteria bacterium]
MRYAGKVLRWLGTALAAVLFLLVAVFALLQTQIGKQWLEKEIARSASSPDFTVTVGRLGGIVPFRMTIERIEIGDRDGVYLTMRDIGVDISATALLAGQAHIRSLSIAEIEMARISTARSTKPFTDYLTVPRLPVGVALDRLSIGRLTLAPPVLGEQLVAALDGSAELIRATAHIALDLHRTDGSAGNITLALELAGAPPVLSVRLDAADPTGLLADRLFGRTDRQPLALALHGAGPVTDWHGQMSASAGAVARFDADLTLAAAAKTVLGVSATATLTPLLPAEFAPLAGDPITLSLRATFGERLIVNLRSLETAAGTLAGDAEFGRTDKTLVAHLRADLPELARAAPLLGQPVGGAASLTAEVTGTDDRPRLDLNFSGRGMRLGPSNVEHLEADISASPTGVLNDPHTRVDIRGQGRIIGLALPEQAAAASGL